MSQITVFHNVIIFHKLHFLDKQQQQPPPPNPPTDDIPFGRPAHQTGFFLASAIGRCVQSCSRHFGKSFQHLISHIYKKKKKLQVCLCLSGSRLVSVTLTVFMRH